MLPVGLLQPREGSLALPQTETRRRHDRSRIETLDCSDPLDVQPTFTWSGEGYDRFRVMVSWEEGFREGARISSGEPLLTTTSWTPDPEAWGRICSVVFNHPREAPSVHVRIVGVDTDSGSEDSERTVLGPTTSYYARMP